MLTMLLRCSLSALCQIRFPLLDSIPLPLVAMSKLGAPPPPPPYKVPLTERLFGIGKLRPPVTAGVEHGSGDALPATIRLGDFTLVMDARGEWQMSSALVSMYQSQISALESKVAQLEDERLNRNVFELEKSNIALERKQLDLQEENNQLKFKNKVLMAMCTISEVRALVQHKQRSGINVLSCLDGNRLSPCNLRSLMCSFDICIIAPGGVLCCFRVITNLYAKRLVWSLELRRSRCPLSRRRNPARTRSISRCSRRRSQHHRDRRSTHTPISSELRASMWQHHQ